MGRGEKTEGEMYGESNIETYNTICKIDSQWGFAVWLRELKQGLCDNLEEWDGEEDGREGQVGGDMAVPMADSCWCVTGKPQTSVKQVSFNFKKYNKIKNLGYFGSIQFSSFLSVHVEGSNAFCLSLYTLQKQAVCESWNQSF